ncbi:MAG: hypothetical protein EPN20_07110, partial [Magnetospirillum sp.]
MAFALTLLAANPAWAENLPQFPKIGPPQPLPDPACNTAIANNGQWLLGNWVAPQARWTFTRKEAGAIAWTMDRKSSADEGFGWQQGAIIDGMVSAVSGCTVALSAGEGAFAFEGVLGDGD